MRVLLERLAPTPPRDDREVSEAVICLRALAEFHPPGQEAVERAGGVPLVLSLLQHSSLDVQMAAIDAVLSLVRSNPTIKALCHGHVTTVANLVHSPHESIRAVACGVLMELARENDTYQELIFQSKVTTALIKAIACPNEYMQFHALGTITFLIWQSEERRRAFLDAGLEESARALLKSPNDNIRRGAEVIAKILRKPNPAPAPLTGTDSKKSLKKK